jgi:hypothetical protein
LFEFQHKHKTLIIIGACLFLLYWRHYR